MFLGTGVYSMYFKKYVYNFGNQVIYTVNRTEFVVQTLCKPIIV